MDRSHSQRRVNGKFAPEPIAHGTANGFRQHERRGEKPPEGSCGCREAYNAYQREINPGGHGRRKGDCSSSFCGKRDVQVRRHDGQDYCIACYDRWQSCSFEGHEPPPRAPSALERAREHREILLAKSPQAAAWRIGVTIRTAERYRALLQEDDRRRQDEEEHEGRSCG